MTSLVDPDPVNYACVLERARLLDVCSGDGKRRTPGMSESDLALRRYYRWQRQSVLD